MTDRKPWRERDARAGEMWAGTYDILAKRVNGSCSTFLRVFFRFAKTPNPRQMLPEKFLKANSLQLNRQRA